MYSQSKPQPVILCIKKLILKFMRRDKRCSRASSLSKEKNKAGELILPDSKTEDEVQ
jgi:hypothetical protein